MDKSRTELLVGLEGIKKLEKTRVTIVGTGGVGGNVALFLLRAGIENFTLIDFDVVAPSNLNRQVVAFEDTIGRSKVEVLKEIMQKINKNAKISCQNSKISAENVAELIKDTDIVVDAIDSVQNKADLIIYCKKHNINIISAMGAGNRIENPQYYLTDIYKTHDDGLAKALRKLLRAAGVEKLDVVTCGNKPIKIDRQIGSISYYPAMCAGAISSVIITKILKEEI